MSDFMTIRPGGAELLHASRQTYGRTGMTTLIVAFRDSANASFPTNVLNLCTAERGHVECTVKSFLGWVSACHVTARLIPECDTY
jgi:hypothetical protein